MNVDIRDTFAWTESERLRLEAEAAELKERVTELEHANLWLRATVACLLEHRPALPRESLV